MKYVYKYEYICTYVYTIEMVFTDISAVFSMELAKVRRVGEVFFSNDPVDPAEKNHMCTCFMRQPTVSMLYHRYTPYSAICIFIHMYVHMLHGPRGNFCTQPSLL